MFCQQLTCSAWASWFYICIYIYIYVAEHIRARAQWNIPRRVQVEGTTRAQRKRKGPTEAQEQGPTGPEGMAHQWDKKSRGQQARANEGPME